MRLRRILGWALAVVVAFVVVAVVPWWYTEASWFASLGQGRVFWKSAWSEWGVGLVGGVVFGGIVLLSVEAALRRTARVARDALGVLGTPIRWLVRAGAAGVGLFAGMAIAGQWLEIQVWLHATAVGAKDPIFGKDIGFYLLELPAIETIRGTLVLAVWIAAAGAAAVYFVAARGLWSRPVSWLVLRHGGILAAILFTLFAWGHVLDRYDLLSAGHGVAAGAGYADVHARAPAYSLAAIAALVAAAGFAWTAWSLRLRAAVLGVALYAGVVVFGAWLYPTIVQGFSVEPNELARERPFIRRAIEGTRAAYVLGRVEARRIAGDRGPSAASVERAHETTENVRLWDWQPLLATYGQLQVIRSYYDFHDVDIDRYPIDGRPRQLMLSVRELSLEKLPENAQTWVNLHIKYTHGYGLVASPVNTVTREGLPDLWMKDIPPRTDVDALALAEPAIYFGEETDDYVLVGTSTPEFDFPQGERNRTTRWHGQSGVALGGTLSRTAWSLRLGATQLLLSSYVRPQTRVLFRRNIVERLTALAPFVTWDRDPYPVVSGRRVKWIIDGYTTASTYPYAEADAAGNNYIRNSVKAVVDAYDGTTTLYAWDPDDPVLGAYRRIFPTLFTARERIPADLREHLRYPVDLFRVQVAKWAAFHMEDPEVFYNKEDLWQVPEESVGSERRTMDPYYVTMRLPDSAAPEFLLILPLAAARRDNMVAFLAARNDGDRLGQVIEYILPKDRLVYGPAQIEARIDQDPQVSQLMTLWDQRGSQVLRGTLLVIPVDGSFLYVEPLYLQAERGSMPELKRVIVTAGERVVMGETLEGALAQITGRAVAAAPAVPTASPTAESAPAPAPAALPASPVPAGEGEALRHLEAARAKLAAGDWAGYAAEMEALERVLREGR
jgi:hypothetical protein